MQNRDQKLGPQKNDGKVCLRNLPPAGRQVLGRRDWPAENVTQEIAKIDIDGETAWEMWAA